MHTLHTTGKERSTICSGYNNTHVVVLGEALVAVVRHVDLLAAGHKCRPQLLQPHRRAARARHVRPGRQHRRGVQHADSVAGSAKCKQ